METPPLHHALGCGGFHVGAAISAESHVSVKPHLKTDRGASPIAVNWKIWPVLDKITSLVVYFDAVSG